MMDWICTDGHGFRIKRNCLALAAFTLFFLYLVPHVSGSKDSESTSFESRDSDNSELTLNADKPIIGNYHHKRKHHMANKYDEDTFKTFKHKDEHKRRFHGKNKIHRNKLMDDYDDTAEQRVAKEANIINNLKYLESDKKYFDYFPIEDVKLNYDPKDDDISVVMLSNDDDDVKKKRPKKFSHSNKKYQTGRSKRDVTNDESSISKRQISPNDFLESERGNNIPRGNSNGQRQVSNSRRGDYYSYDTPNDPWDNRFTRTLNNFYLPVPRPQGFIKYPIRGVYYNPIVPSRGYVPVKPSTTTDPTNVIMRFGADDDHLVWDSEVRSPTVRNDLSSTTRRPAPPLIHMPSRNRNPNRTTPRPSAELPPGAAANSIDDDRFVTKAIPPRPAARPTTRQPSRRPLPPQEPSKCVWAIVSCCARNNLDVRYACFEQVGCHGAFWDYNPCADQIQDAAIDVAAKFFD